MEGWRSSCEAKAKRRRGLGLPLAGAEQRAIFEVAVYGMPYKERDEELTCRRNKGYGTMILVCHCDERWQADGMDGCTLFGAGVAEVGEFYAGRGTCHADLLLPAGDRLPVRELAVGRRIRGRRADGVAAQGGGQR